MRIAIALSRSFAAATTGTPPAMTSMSPFKIPDSAAGLPAVTTSAETLEVLLADLGQHSRTFHSMRAMAKVEGWSIDSTSLCAESGKLVMKFIELSVESRGPL